MKENSKSKMAMKYCMEYGIVSEDMAKEIF
jgi:hypothetical protein